MYHRWVLTSKTGQQYEGVDVFPSEELKAKAVEFELFTDVVQTLVGPFGEFKGNHIYIAIPYGHELVFKRRTQMVYGQERNDFVLRHKEYKYIVTVRRLEG